MKFSGFVFFSTLEYLSFFYLTFVLFRFSLKENLLKFSVFSIVLSFVSNTFQIESLRAISPLLQFLLMICFVVFFLKVHWFNSTIMILTGYIVISIVQWIIIALTLHFGGVKEVVPYTEDAFIIQAATAFLVFVFGLVIYLQKGGFSFVDNTGRLRRSKFFVKENKLFIIFLFFSIAITFASNILFVALKHPPYLFFSILLFIVLLTLIYISVKRDGREHG